MQAKKCTFTGDIKHDYLFHKQMNYDLSNKEPEYKEKNLTYKQVENLIKESSRKLNKENLRRSK